MASPAPKPQDRPLTRAERIWTWVLFAAIAVFGAWLAWFLGA